MYLVVDGVDSQINNKPYEPKYSLNWSLTKGLLLLFERTYFTLSNHDSINMLAQDLHECSFVLQVVRACSSCKNAAGRHHACPTYERHAWIEGSIDKHG